MTTRIIKLGTFEYQWLHTTTVSKIRPDAPAYIIVNVAPAIADLKELFVLHPQYLFFKTVNLQYLGHLGYLTINSGSCMPLG